MGRFKWLVPVSSLLASIYDAFDLHLTHWQLNSHLNPLCHEEGGVPPSLPGIVLTFVRHLCGLPTLALGITWSVPPSWPSETSGALPTNCSEDPELAAPAAWTGKLGWSWVWICWLCLSCTAVVWWCPSSINNRIALRCADLPIHSTNASTRGEHITRAASFMRPWHPCLS